MMRIAMVVALVACSQTASPDPVLKERLNLAEVNNRQLAQRIDTLIAMINTMRLEPKWWCGPRMCTRDQDLCDAATKTEHPNESCLPSRIAYCNTAMPRDSVCFLSREACKAAPDDLRGSCLGVE